MFFFPPGSKCNGIITHGKENNYEHRMYRTKYFWQQPHRFECKKAYIFPVSARKHYQNIKQSLLLYACRNEIKNKIAWFTSHLKKDLIFLIQRKGWREEGIKLQTLLWNQRSTTETKEFVYNHCNWTQELSLHREVNLQLSPNSTFC